MPRLLLRTYHGSKILQFDTGSSFLITIHIVYYCQYAKFRNAPYENVHLNLLQGFLKIKLMAHSQLSKKFVDKFRSPSFCFLIALIAYSLSSRYRFKTFDFYNFKQSFFVVSPYTLEELQAFFSIM